MSALTPEIPETALYPDWMEEVDAPQLIQDSERLSGITDFLNLEDLDKRLPFLFYPFASDFERFRVQVREHERVYGAYHLDSRFDGSVWKKMRVMSRQLAPRTNAYKAYCELKSQLCLERNDFFYEIYSKVESRVKAGGSSADKTELLMNLVCLIRRLYDVYL